MELCAGGELFELAAGTSSVKREGASMLDTEARIAVLVKQMAAAIRYIHSMGMVHRDIKLENWVFASPQQERLKLIDFGLATQIVTEGRAKKLMQMCGTCYYVAPEIIGLKDGAICKGDGYGQEVDVWALGVLIYMLVSGMPPFNGKNHADDLIRRCMEREPEKRLTAAGVQMHPWLCQVASGQMPLMALAPVDSFRSIAALDRTGDGRLHFFEFLGAMIGAGRIQIHEADAQVLNRTTSSENLAFPIEDRTTLLEALNRKPCWASELPMPPAVVPPKPVEAAPNPPQMQKLLSKAKLQMEWQVQRQVAYRDVRSAVKLKSLNRGYRTPDPSPTRNAEKEEDQTSGAGLDAWRMAARNPEFHEP
eukprot:g1616.t1